MTTEFALWISSPEYCSPESLHDLDDEQLARVLTISTADMTDCGWVKVGSATVTMKLLSRDEMLGSAIEGIRKQIDATKAEAEAKVTALTRKLNDLLMIPLSKSDSSAGESL